MRGKKCLNNRKVKMVRNMKKAWKIVMIIIAILVSILGIIYMIDISRMKQNKPVLFSDWGRKYNEPTKEEKKNGDDSKTEYSLEQAIQEGCFVITNNNKIYNKGNLDRFIKNTDINAENRKEDFIKIVQYTKEGDPIITELSYQIKDETYLFKGEQVNETTYVLKVDNTRDRFAAESDRKVIIDNDIPGKFFGITEEKEGKTVRIELSLCAIIEYATKDAKQYKTIEVCSYSKDSEIVQDFPSFYGTVIESKQGNIIVEPREGESIRKSSDKISISLGKNSDVVYPLGTNVKITYTGDIRETYPAQVTATNIELKSAENFEVKFYDKHSQRDEKIDKITEILGKSEMKQYDYNIYSYDGTVNIIINGEETSLRKALLENKITMNEIIQKANQDIPNATIYKDGGSMEYHYKDYTIIKVHRIDGNRDVYIGGPKLNINDLSL